MVKKGRKMKPAFDKNGYRRLGLAKEDGKVNHKRVARLVAETYIPNPDNKPQVNHINGIKDDDRVENLEWCTNRENISHARETGLWVPKINADSHSTKLSECDVIIIKKMIKNGSIPQCKIADVFGVQPSQISRIKNGTRRLYVGL